MLLRNINQSLGLCNGTSLIITRMGDRVLEGETITGSNKGQRVCVPRIVLNPAGSKWPFTVRWCQFTIRLCYAMTINKS
uniref:DNA helicase Pif1-like 2B domain-containing protein n=1 Tax=Aegilops tauschii subsp. strangulata TaxID=200361 RepID=A0A453AD72_AEGTS